MYRHYCYVTLFTLGQFTPCILLRFVNCQINGSSSSSSSRTLVERKPATSQPGKDSSHLAGFPTASGETVSYTHLTLPTNREV